MALIPAQPNLSLPSFSSFITIKLSSDNFSLWRTQVTPYLRAHGLFEFVDGSSVCPPEAINDTPNPAYPAWVATDQLVMAILTSSLTEDVLARVIDCTTSSEIWTTILDLLSAQIVHTRFQLAYLQKGANSITEYFNRARNLRQLMSAAGHPLSDMEFSTYVLAGLGSDFESVVTRLSTQSSLPSPKQIFSHLLVHEARFAHQVKGLAASNPSITVNPTSSQVAAEGHFTTRNEGRGFYSNKQVHTRGQSQQNNNLGSANRGSTRGKVTNFTAVNNARLICQVCSRSGHTALKCWHRFDQAF